MSRLQQKKPTSTLKRLQPGDVLDLTIKLRQLMTNYESCGYLLYADYSELDPSLEREAEKARHTLELSATRLAALLTQIETTPAYTALKKRVTETRKRRDG